MLCRVATPPTPGQIAPRPNRRGLKERWGNWVAGPPDDPIPTALTVIGLIISAFGLGWGIWADWHGFALNLSASITLIGPGLLISNVIVRRVQTVRVRRQLEPMVGLVYNMLFSATQTAQQACDMLGIEAAFDVAPESNVVSDLASVVRTLTFSRVDSALADAKAALPTSDDLSTFPRELLPSNALVFPRFGVVLRYIEQIDQRHPIPWAVSTAILADDWADGCGVDFVTHTSAAPDENQFGVRERIVGLSGITQESLASSDQVGTGSYVQAVQQCLGSSRAILNTLHDGLPASLRR